MGLLMGCCSGLFKIDEALWGYFLEKDLAGKATIICCHGTSFLITG